METPEIKVTPNANGELIIRTGDAGIVYEPEPLMLHGTISAPADFAEARCEEEERYLDPTAYKTNGVVTTTQCHQSNTHVIANYTERRIELVSNESRPEVCDRINGALVLHPRLQGFRINQPYYYDKHSLFSLLKLQRTFFADAAEHTKLMADLKKLDAKVDQVFKDQNDLKGTAGYQKLVEIQTNLDLEFKLSIPLFAGEDRSKFKVDICLDNEGGGIRFWLESAQMYDMMLEETERIFEEQLARLADYVIIKKW